MSELADLLYKAFKIVRFSIPWMGWNLFLAVIPLALSLWLFRSKRTSNLKWWLGVIAFVAFLPNAPYVLTDAIHLPRYIHAYSSRWLVALVTLPLFLGFMLAGFEAYVLSLINVGSYLHRQNFQRWIFPIELILHGLSAVGVYLGRFVRFNSWDLATQPHVVLSVMLDTFTRKYPLVVTFLFFLIVAILYAMLKFLTLAAIQYQAQSVRSQPYP